MIFEVTLQSSFSPFRLFFLLVPPTLWAPFSHPSQESLAAGAPRELQYQGRFAPGPPSRPVPAGDVLRKAFFTV